MKWFLSLLAVVLSVPAFAQNGPPAKASYVFNVSLGTWVADTTTTDAGAGDLPNAPPAAALYCLNTATNQWTPATTAGNCFGSSAGATWGSITGTLSSQTDLNTALSAKLPLAGGPMTGATGGNPIAGGINATQYLLNGVSIGGGSSVGTAGQVQMVGSTAGSFAASTATDNGSLFSISEPLAATVVESGTPSSAALAALPTGTHGFSCDESATVGVPASAVDYLRCDATTHQILLSQNDVPESALASAATIQTALTTNYYVSPTATSNESPGGNNTIRGYGFVLPQTVNFSNIYVVSELVDTGLATVTGISGDTFTGSGTLLLSAFNNGCTGSTVTVTIASGVFASASLTATGSGCTSAPTSATCTSGTATCVGSPLSITVTSALNLYSAAIANATTGALVCHPTTAQQNPANNASLTFACSEGAVTLTANQPYIFLSTGNGSLGPARWWGVTAGTSVVPFYSTAVSGCTSSLGVISGTCTISLAMAVPTNATPNFSLH